jgi:hypothetical protein
MAEYRVTIRYRDDKGPPGKRIGETHAYVFVDSAEEAIERGLDIRGEDTCWNEVLDTSAEQTGEER